MLKRDYVAQSLNELVHTIFKMEYDIDTEMPTAEVLDEEDEKVVLKHLFDMVDGGYINEAENQFYALQETEQGVSLKLALLFYLHLNEKDDGFLEDHDFSREEVKLGIQNVSATFGLEGLTDVFL